MKIISSEAGERLARAKRELDETRADGWEVSANQLWEYRDAAEAVADDLVAQGFGNAEGD